LCENKRRAKDEDTPNKSMDVRQKQLLLFGVSRFRHVARSRFLPTSSPPLNASLKKLMEMLKTTNGFARGAKIVRLFAACGFPPRRV